MTRALLAVLMALLALAQAVAPASMSASRVIRVPVDYPTIQAAVDAALPGDTIIVYPGTYNESVTVNVASITIAGNATIMPTSGKPGILIAAPGVTIEGLTVESNGSPAIQVNLAPQSRATLLGTTLNARNAPAILVGPLIARATITIKSSTLNGDKGLAAEPATSIEHLSVTLENSSISCAIISGPIGVVKLNASHISLEAGECGDAINIQGAAHASLRIEHAKINGTISATAATLNTTISEAILTAQPGKTAINLVAPLAGGSMPRAVLKNVAINVNNATGIRLKNMGEVTLDHVTIDGQPSIGVLYNSMLLSKDQTIKINKTIIKNTTEKSIVINPDTRDTFIKQTIYINNSIIQSNKDGIIIKSRNLIITNSSIISEKIPLLIIYSNTIINSSMIESRSRPAVVLGYISKSSPWNINLTVQDSKLSGREAIYASNIVFNNIYINNSYLHAYSKNSIIIRNRTIMFMLNNSVVNESIVISKSYLTYIHNSIIYIINGSSIIDSTADLTFNMNNVTIRASGSLRSGVTARAASILLREVVFDVHEAPALISALSTSNAFRVSITNAAFVVDEPTRLLLGTPGGIELRNVSSGGNGSVTVEFMAESLDMRDVSLEGDSLVVVNESLPVNASLSRVWASNVSIGGAALVYVESLDGQAIRVDEPARQVIVYGSRGSTIAASPGVRYVLVVSSRGVNVSGLESGSLFASNSSVTVTRFRANGTRIVACCGSNVTVYLSVLTTRTVESVRGSSVRLFSPWPLRYKYLGEAHVNYLGNYWVGRARSPVEDLDRDGVLERPVNTSVGTDPFPLKDYPRSYAVLGRLEKAAWIEGIDVTGRIVMVRVAVALEGLLRVYVDGETLWNGSVSPGKTITVKILLPRSRPWGALNITLELVDRAGVRHVMSETVSLEPREETTNGTNTTVPALPEEPSGGPGPTTPRAPVEGQRIDPLALVLAAGLAMVVGVAVARGLRGRR